MRRLLLLLLIVPTLVVAASGVAASSMSVSITNTGFRPSSVTVAAGDNVTWTNNDAQRHQIVANTGSFSSPVLAAKQSWSHTFRSGGTFAYHDGLHPALKASVTVVPQRTVWIMNAGFSGIASTLSIAVSSVARASGLAGFSKPIWLSEIWTKEKPPSAAFAAPMRREAGTPPATVQTTPVPAQIMHFRV